MSGSGEMLVMSPRESAILARIAESPFIDEKEALALLSGSDPILLAAARAILQARGSGTRNATDNSDPAPQSAQAAAIASAYVESARSNVRPKR